MSSRSPRSEAGGIPGPTPTQANLLEVFIRARREVASLVMRREKIPGVKLREKGKKESQVFTSVADNPRRVYRPLAIA
jgi:hypothetical protein